VRSRGREQISFGLRGIYDELAKIDPRNDGQMLFYDQIIPGGALLGSQAAAIIAIGAEKPLTRLVDHALASDRYDLTDAHLAAIFALESRLAKLPGAEGAARRRRQGGEGLWGQPQRDHGRQRYDNRCAQEPDV
jgi:hypothetical protein